MRNLWADLVSDNPLMAKAAKSLSLIKNIKAMPSSSWVVLSLVALVYLVLVGTALKVAEAIDSSVFLFLMLTVVVLVAATVLHGSLAGEREKRTIDLLLVAPVTTAQIIAAKVVKVVLPLISVIFVCVVPAIILAVVRANLGVDTWSGRSAGFDTFLLAIGITLSTGCMVVGATVYVSSVNRTNANALTATLGILFLWFIVLPILLGSFGVVSHDFSESLMVYHPFYAMSKVLFPGRNEPLDLAGFSVSFLIHAAIGIGGLVAAAKVLERERKTGARQSA